MVLIESDDLATSPIAWHGMATDLHDTVKTLWLARPERELAVEAYTMLCGMALESLYKGMIVLITGEVLPTKYEKHELNILARAAGMDVNEKDIVTLQIYSHFVQWGGRYAYSKDPQGRTKLFRLMDKHLAENPRPDHPNGWKRFYDLWKPADDSYAKIFFDKSNGLPTG